MPGNMNGPRDIPEYVQVAGIQFTVFKGGRTFKKITGAAIGFI